jgi:hypothetical protein
MRAVARGWSNEDLEEARRCARERAAKVAAALASGDVSRQQYFYGERPLPEPIVREFQNEAGETIAAVTRNSYGSLVLNTEELMFIDVDEGEPAAPQPGSDLISSVLSLFGKRQAPAVVAAGPVQRAERIARERGLGVRAYKTASGYRFLISNYGFDATSGEAESLMKQFGADPLYVRLCKSQECFRARLTPKPWRANAPQPPATFPFEGDRERARFEEWERQYNGIITRYATCRLTGTYGSTLVEPRFAQLIDYHDQVTNVSSGLPLA